MSFFGMGRPQPSSEEKIGMMENEIIAMSDLHNRFVAPLAPSIPFSIGGMVEIHNFKM